MTPAPLAAPRRLSRLSTWLSHAPPPAQAPRAAPSPAHDDTPAARLYAEVGEFLFSHDLPLTSEMFGLAVAYVRGEDRALTLAIRDQLHSTGSLGVDFLRHLAETRGTGMRPAAVARMAATLAAQLAQCLALLGESRSSAEEYGSALDREAARMDGEDDGDAMARLIDLTATAVTTSRHMAARLEEKRLETTLLRDNLDRALRAAEQDHLTGLTNRRGFDARLQAREQAGGDTPWCVALCDIDDFKRINDRHGHDTGDRVLKLVAKVLRTALEPDAIVARHGGEEFACLFGDASAADAFARLDTVRASLADRALVNQDNGEPIGTLTLSIGVAAVTEDPVRAMRDADTALYAAKRGGKNRVVAHVA